jgi:hypothetical protein
VYLSGWGWDRGRMYGLLAAAVCVCVEVEIKIDTAREGRRK